MKVELKDFPLNTPFDVAGKCQNCGGKLRAQITFIDPHSGHRFGDLFWECQQCGASDTEIAGWVLSDKPVKIMAENDRKRG